MKIVHRITSIDKLKEILKITGWKQKDLAKELDVSPKTMSFWLNNKRRPAEDKEKLIGELYNKTVEAKSLAEITNIVKDYQARDGLEEREKVFNENEKNYYDAKCYVLAKEKDNDALIYLYPSQGKDDGWYKLGGRSLLFYKNLLAPRLGREAKIRDDSDKVHRFNSGIASVRWGERLMEEAKALGYTAKKIKYNIIVLGLGKKFTGAEIREMKEKAREERLKVKKMIEPKANYPSLMMAMNKLAQVLPSKVKKLDASYREIWGKELLQPMVEMLKIYFRFANGRMEKRDAKLEMLERTDDIAAMIYMMDEAGMLNITARTRLGENVVEIRREIEGNL